MSSEAQATALCEKLFGHRYNDDEEEGHEKWMPCHDAILAAERDAAAWEREAILRTLQLVHDEHSPTNAFAKGVRAAISCVQARIIARETK